MRSVGSSCTEFVLVVTRYGPVVSTVLPVVLLGIVQYSRNPLPNGMSLLGLYVTQYSLSLRSVIRRECCIVVGNRLQR
jgi:hypothetical protein